MKTLFSFGILPFLLFVATAVSYSQGTTPFDSAAYRLFLSTHQNLTTGQLQALYPAGTFAATSPVNYETTRYFDSISLHYPLTPAEKAILGKQGFVVSERLSQKSYGDAYSHIYNSDLPVFVSTDAILHAIHMSWDAILMGTEKNILAAKLDTLLSELQGQLPAMASGYASVPGMTDELNDLDVYLTVPRLLLGDDAQTQFPSNAKEVVDLLNLINKEAPAGYPLFSSSLRSIDFSQFTVRGHYTQDPVLSKYFQAMMWLGRIEIYLAPPVTDGLSISSADIRRQVVDAALIKEAADRSGGTRLLTEINGILEAFVGPSDNVTLPEIADILSGAGITSASQLLDSATCVLFQQTLAQKPYADQKINSQILMSNPMDLNQSKPASSFLLLGQRFIVDSYTTGSVVYDKIIYEGQKVTRMLPSSLDVLFALGNNAAGQLLTSELDQYHYGSNLSAVRYLIDGYDPTFWEGTIYNGWLNSIRALNPPADRSGFPAFMQTAAWWQEKINTQLASWAELRHDFILYAKQSYTFGTTCSFPESYVEPIPEFYDAVKAFAQAGDSLFNGPLCRNSSAAGYFVYLGAVADTLGTISQKELSGTSFTASEKHFLRTMLYTVEVGCALQTKGWYPSLYYTGESGFTKEDMIIADIHTAPTDAAGNPVGWVLHVGTGPLNMAVVVGTASDGTPCTFIGPVSSYYEYLATNFKRLTDEEWATMVNISPSLRPSFINLYASDTTGAALPLGESLVMGVNHQPAPPTVPGTLTLQNNFPNPFNSSTIIAFTIPPGLANSDVRLSIYDIGGRVVRQVVSGRLPAGNYAARWDGTSEGGATVASGIYFCRLVAGNQHAVRRIAFVK